MKILVSKTKTLECPIDFKQFGIARRVTLIQKISQLPEEPVMTHALTVEDRGATLSLGNFSRSDMEAFLVELRSGITDLLTRMREDD